MSSSRSSSPERSPGDDDDSSSSSEESSYISGFTTSSSSSSEDEVGSEASPSSDEDGSESDGSDGSDSGDSSDGSSDDSASERRNRKLTPQQLAEKEAMKRSLKHVKKFIFKQETPGDPQFFNYLTKMHEWASMNDDEKRRALTEERKNESEQFLYDPVDGVANGLKSIWDAIQIEVDALPVHRRISSPLKFRALVNQCMDLEQNGRMRRMMMMERSILHTVLYMLRTLNGKIQHPPNMSRSFGSPMPSPDAAEISRLSTLPEDGPEDADADVRNVIAVPARNNSAHSASRARSNSRQAHDEESKSQFADDGVPLRTRSSLKRTESNSLRPTTFHNIPNTKQMHHAHAHAHPSSKSKSAKPKPQTPVAPAASSSRTLRAASVPPQDVPASALMSATDQSIETPQGSRKRRRAPRSNDSALTHATAVTATTRGSHKTPLLAPSRNNTLSVPTHSLTRKASNPSPNKSEHSTSRQRASPLNLAIIHNTPHSKHRLWIAGLLKHRDDLHMLMLSVLFMAFVHVTDSEKLAALKKHMLSTLLQHAGWGKQKIQEQMHKLLRVPTMSTGTTSGAAAFSETATPLSPNAQQRHRNQKSPASAHALNPNSSMIYMFDSMCIDLIDKDVLPLLSSKVPGDELEADDAAWKHATGVIAATPAPVHLDHVEEEEESKENGSYASSGQSKADMEDMGSQEDASMDDADAGDYEADGDDAEDVGRSHVSYRSPPKVKKPIGRVAKKRASAAKKAPAKAKAKEAKKLALQHAAPSGAADDTEMLDAAPVRRLRSHSAASHNGSVRSDSRSPAMKPQALTARLPSNSDGLARPAASVRRPAGSMFPSPKLPSNDVRSPALNPANRATPTLNAAGNSPRWSSTLSKWIGGALGWNGSTPSLSAAPATGSLRRNSSAASTGAASAVSAVSDRSGTSSRRSTRQTKKQRTDAGDADSFAALAPPSFSPRITRNVRRAAEAALLFSPPDGQTIPAGAAAASSVPETRQVRSRASSVAEHLPPVPKAPISTSSNTSKKTKANSAKRKR